MKRFQLTAIAAAIAVATVCPAALAAGRAGSPLRYALHAVGFRSYFIFDTRPGRTVSGTLRVVELTQGARTVLLSPADVSTASAGGLQYGNSTPHQEGRWLTMTRRTVRLAGKDGEDIPFTVRVPRNASPGDHFVAIVAVDRRALAQRFPAHGQIRLRLIPRLAMTVQLRLPGPSTRALALGSIGIAVAPSGASLAFKLSNPSNQLIGSSSGRVTVSQRGTVLFHQRLDLAGFVPKTTITYNVPWEGMPVEGSYRVTGELRPAGAPPITFDRIVRFDRSAIRQFRQQTGRPAHETPGTPVVLIVVLLMSLVAAAVFAAAYARARRQLHHQG